MKNGQPIQQRWIGRKVDFTVKLIFPTRGIREVSSGIFRLQEISEGGATLYVGSVKNVPDFFYIQFGDENSEMIGCYSVGREQRVLFCQFTKVMPRRRVAEIIAEKAKTTLLDGLFELREDESPRQGKLANFSQALGSRMKWDALRKKARRLW